jgi:flagellar hook-basal body complex protein FliE
MAGPIAPIQISLPPIAPAASPAAPKGVGGDAFGAVFAEAVAKVETFQTNAKASVDRFLSGEGEELHQVALKTQQAELSFELFLEVRNKVVSAYQEVMRMQV